MTAQRLTHPDRYRMILLDLDGTALRPDSTLSPRTERAVRNATEAGAVVVLCSARPPRSIREYHRALGLDTPLVCYNGGLGIYPSGEIIFRHPMDATLARRVVALLRSHCPGANLSLECDDTWHIDRVDDDLRRSLEHYRVDPPHTEGQVDAVLLSDTSVSKVLLSLSQVVEGLAEEFERAFGGGVTVSVSGDLLEVVAEGVSKGRAAADLVRLYGIQVSELAAFGDHYNDVPMLEYAGLGVAMGNAPDGVKGISNHVAPSNAEDGVAVVLEEMLENGELRRNG